MVFKSGNSRPFSSGKRILIIGAVVLIVLSIVFILLGFFQKKETLKTDDALDNNRARVEEGLLSSLFPCPLEVGHCSIAVTVYSKKDYRIAGFGFRNLPSNNFNIIAMVSGEINIDKSTVNGVLTTTATILSEDDDFEITYIFSGSTFVTGEGAKVLRRDVIASLDGGTITSPHSDVRYQLYVSVKDIRTGQIIPLVPTNEGDGLILFIPKI